MEEATLPEMEADSAEVEEEATAATEAIKEEREVTEEVGTLYATAVVETITFGKISVAFP